VPYSLLRTEYTDLLDAFRTLKTKKPMPAITNNTKRIIKGIAQGGNVDFPGTTGSV